MCQITITALIRSPQSDVLFVIGTVSGCPATFSRPGSDELFAKVEVEATRGSQTATAEVLVTSSGQFTVLLKGVDADCDDRVDLRVACLGRDPGDPCELRETRSVSCPDCARVVFDDPVFGPCQANGKRAVTITAHFPPTGGATDLAEFATVGWRYAQNETTFSVVVNGETSITIELADEDFNHPVVLSVTGICIVPLDLPAQRPCRVDCPGDLELAVFAADGTPVTSFEPCVAPGRYRISVANPPPGILRWKESVGNGLLTELTAFQDQNPINFDLPADGQIHTVHAQVQLTSGDCPDAIGSVALTPCGRVPVPVLPQPPQVVVPAPPPIAESVWCTILRILAFAVLFTGLALIIGGACSVTPPLVGIGVGLAIVGALLLVAWALACGQADNCMILQRTIELLEILTVVLLILAAIFAVLALLGFGAPCFVGIMIDLGIVGALTVVLHWIFRIHGCQFQNPWIGG